jgi:hypothetical protein
MNNSFEYSGRDNLEVMSLAKNYNNSIFKWLSSGLLKEHSVLDFGAGQGEFFNRIEILCLKNYALEPDSSMHTHYNNKNHSHKSLESVSEKFNLIYSVNVFEHLSDDKLTVIQLKKYLKSDDSIIKIFVPARQELYSAMDEKVGHYRRYSKKQLKALFSENGYKVHSCKYFDFLGYFAAFAYKFLNSSGDIDSKGLVFYDKYIFPISLFLDNFFSYFIGKNLILEASLIEEKIDE